MRLPTFGLEADPALLHLLEGVPGRAQSDPSAAGLLLASYPSGHGYSHRLHLGSPYAGKHARAWLGLRGILSVLAALPSL